MINCGNNTSCRLIRSVIILVSDKQIGLPLRGRLILLPVVWLQTELDSTQSYYNILGDFRLNYSTMYWQTFNDSEDEISALFLNHD